MADNEKLNIEDGANVDQSILEEMGIESETESEQEPEQPEEQQEEQEQDQEAEQVEETKETEEKPFYKDKSRDELIDMVENGTRKITQQGQELSEWKKRIEAIEQANKKSPEEQKKDPYAGYNKEDIATIKQLFREQMENIEKEKQEQIKQQNELNQRDNEAYWRTLEVASPEMTAAIKKSIEDDYVKTGLDGTLYKKDYLLEKVADYRKNGKITGNANSQNVNARKAKAATAGSQGADFGGKAKPSQKDVSKMSFEEYEKYAKEQGLLRFDNK